MMNPDVMKAAMEACSRMSPEQMAEMQRMAASMGPEKMAEMQRMAAQQMARLSPAEQAEAIKRQVGTDPSTVQAALNQARVTYESDPSYQLGSAKLLKDEGNRFFAAKAYDQAAEKYTRAKSSLAGQAAAEARDLRKACQLNLAACLLALERPAEAVAECGEVLDAHPRERKALYRRGVGRLALYDPAAAVPDLHAALELSPEAEKPVIRAKLREAEAALAEELGEAPAARPAERASAAAAGAEQAQPSRPAPAAAAETVEVIPRPAAAQPAARGAAAGYPPMGAFGGMGGGGLRPDAGQLRATAAMLRTNPAMVQQMMAATANMSPESLEAAARMSGQQLPPGMKLTPEMASAAAAGMSSMSPDDMDRMADALESGAAPPGGFGGFGGFGGAGPPAGGMAEAMRMMQADPSIMKTAMDMMGAMPPEQLAAMQRTMAASGMGPQGGGVPGFPAAAAPQGSAAARAAADAAAAGSAVAADGTAAAEAALDGHPVSASVETTAPPPPSTVGGGATAGGMPDMAAMLGGGGMPDMGAMLQNPAMLEMMQGMMKNVSPEQLAAVSRMSGKELSPEEAEAAAARMRGMSDRQIRGVIMASSYAARGWAALQAARRWAAANPMLAAAVVVLLLAILARLLGFL